MAVSPPSRLQEYPTPVVPSSVVMKTTGMFTLLTGPPFLPLEEAACIGRGSGMRSSSVLTSVIFMMIFYSLIGSPSGLDGEPTVVLSTASRA